MTAIEDARVTVGELDRRVDACGLMDAWNLMASARDALRTLIAEHERMTVRSAEAPPVGSVERLDIIEAAVSVIEPNVTNRTHAWNTWNNIASSETFRRAIHVLHADECATAFTTTPPTDDEREALGEAALRAYLAPTAPRPWARLSKWEREKWIAAGLVGFRRQGPITEAMVEAALKGWRGEWADSDEDAMRAALEAAERAR